MRCTPALYELFLSMLECEVFVTQGQTGRLEVRLLSLSVST